MKRSSQSRVASSMACRSRAWSSSGSTCPGGNFKVKYSLASGDSLTSALHWKDSAPLTSISRPASRCRTVVL